MKQEIKQKWVAALRSKKYRQGSGYLRSCGKYCCLGVLCDVVAPNLWGGLYGNTHDGVEKTPSEFVRDASGITQEDVEKLCYMNDEQLCNFNTIATYIEENM